MAKSEVYLLIMGIAQFLIGGGVVMYLFPKSKQIEKLFDAVNGLTKELAEFRERLHVDYVPRREFDQKVENKCWEVVKAHCKECAKHAAVVLLIVGLLFVTGCASSRIRFTRFSENEYEVVQKGTADVEVSEVGKIKITNPQGTLAGFWEEFKDLFTSIGSRISPNANLGE